MCNGSSTHPRCGCIKRYPLEEMGPYEVCILRPPPLTEIHCILSLTSSIKFLTLASLIEFLFLQ